MWRHDLELRERADRALRADAVPHRWQRLARGRIVLHQVHELRAVRLAALDGGDDRALGELLGSTPVVVNFFASWCVPCIDEMPAFEAVHRSLGDRVTFVGMANRDTAEQALGTVEATGVTYPTYDDPDASALTYFGGLGMPTTVFIDASGEVVDVHSGPLTEAELRGRLDDLFGMAA